MKLKAGAFLIILSTAAVIGIINLILNKTTIDTPTTTNNEAPPKIDRPHSNKFSKKAENTGVKVAPKNVLLNEEEFLDDEDDEDDLLAEPPKALADSEDLSKEDLQKINSIVNLSETNLKQELALLKKRIDDEDLFAKLESGELSEPKKAETKDVLERFALLGIEGTRRKFLAMDPNDPELKNPIVAYKDSLKEIRKLLEDDDDDVDDE